jgi:hypothetical protein
MSQGAAGGPPRSSKCEDSVGVLIPRVCGELATVQCSVCRKWVCGKHTATLSQGGLSCTACAGATAQPEYAQRSRLHSFYGFRSYSSGSHLHYGHHSGVHFGETAHHHSPHYRSEDLAAFENSSAGSASTSDDSGMDLLESLDGS